MEIAVLFILLALSFPSKMVDPFDPEELLVCPYDPVHRVARKRMQTHLVKCRKVIIIILGLVMIH